MALVEKVKRDIADSKAVSFEEGLAKPRKTGRAGGFGCYSELPQAVQRRADKQASAAS